MLQRGESGSIVSLLGDRGERYDRTLFDPAWLAARELDLAAANAGLEPLLQAARA